MAETLEFVRWISTVLFVLLALVTGLLARRSDHPASNWAFATFAALAAVVVMSRFTPDEPSRWVGALTISVLLAFPWALFRFAASFGRLSRWIVRTGDVAVAGLVLWTILMPEQPSDAGSGSTALQLYVLAVVIVWVSLSLVVATELWRGGNGEPTLARRRMRLLSAGATTMSIAIIAAAYSPDTGGDGWSVAVQVLAILAALAFLVGFVPPPMLRIAWRQPEERALYTASLKLMGAVTRSEVAVMILPHLAGVVGARAAWILEGDGTPLGTFGDAPPGATGGLEVAAGDATVRVWPSIYAPFFGIEETRLLRRLALLAGLALERADALERERDARQQLEAANSELEAFVYSASHDLKSPLIALLGYLDVIKDDYGDQLDEQGHYYLQRMAHNGTYMEALIADLLELSRVGRVDTELTPVALDEVAREVADDLGGRYPGADVRIGSLPVVWFNPARARQLLTNLMENACRYGGRHDVRVDVFAYDASDGGVSIAVADDGVGIPEEYRDRVFGVFERLGPDELGGTGIGLAICTKIVEVAGGQIELVPTESGARFVVNLPAGSRVAEGTNREART